ncbi:hypothetical protein TRVL_03107 [Trypanosoma vivax]|nr:hypothetical protein TRVL_03107 [Trypanosoma vivax]
MRHYSALRLPTWFVPVLEQRCNFRRKLSPDRTRDEEIQDRQNAFCWADKHLYRPHQHFTYDPCSWSRPLQEKVKQKLSIVERLRILEEQDAEALHNHQHANGSRVGGGNAAHIGEYDVSEDFVANGDYFYAVSDHADEPEKAPGNTVPLQELLDKLQDLCVFLESPRHSGKPLKTLERLKAERSEALLLIFSRVSGAIVGKTITFNALVYTWSILLQNAEYLLEVLLTEVGSSGALTAAIQRAHQALSIVLREAKLYLSDDKACKSMTIQGWIELLDIITHPFTVRSEALEAKNDVKDFVRVQRTNSTAAGLSVDCVYDHTMRALTARMVECHTVKSGEEVLDPRHAYLLAQVAVRWRGATFEESHIQRIASLVRGVSEGCLSALKSAVAPSSCHTARIALSRSTPRRTDSNAGAGGEYLSGAQPSPIPLDDCAPPNGVKEVPIAADDAAYLTQACLALLLAASSTFPATRKKLVEAYDTVALMLSFTPNYDLSVSDTVLLVCEVLDKFRGDDEFNTMERHLRILLLLSRLHFPSCSKQCSLSRLFRCMCNFSTPSMCGKDHAREWKRLRGHVMHHLLHTVRAEELQAYYNSHVQTKESWMEQLAFGAYRGSMPLSLWYSGCNALLSTAATFSPDCVRAMLILRARCKHPGSYHNVSIYRSCTDGLPGMEFESVQLVAKIVECASEKRCTAADLISNRATWDAVVHDLEEIIKGDTAALEVLRAAQGYVGARQVDGAKVITLM